MIRAIVSATVTKRFIARLKRDLKRRGITHDRVAAAAEVHRTTVVNVLAGRMKSRNVVETAERLLNEADAAPIEQAS